MSSRQENYALVTGGAGFIGSHLVYRLLSDGWSVVVFDNFHDFYDPRLKEQNIHWLKASFPRKKLLVRRGDLREVKDVRRICSTFSFRIVFHLAALAGVRSSIKHPADYHDVNAGGTLTVLDACHEYGIKNFIYGSSSSVYGDSRQVPFREDQDAEHPVSPYAASKRAGELYVHTFHHLYNLNSAVLRFFTVYGPRQRPDLAIHKFTKHLLFHRPIEFFGNGSTSRDYTFIHDIVDGTVRAAQWLIKQPTPVFEIFNLGNSSPVLLTDLIMTLEKVVGRKALVKHLPLQQGDVFITFADISKSRAFLGFNPSTTFEDGLRAFVDWFQAEPLVMLRKGRCRSG